MRRNKSIKPGDDVDPEISNLDTSEYICSAHIDDNFIRSFIKKNGEKGKCDYCDKKNNVVELHEVLILIITGIDYIYEDPANSRYLNKKGTHGFDGNTMDFYDLWRENHLGLTINDNTLFEDLFNYLNNYNLYCEKDEYGSETDYLNYSWTYFKEIVKHKV